MGWARPHTPFSSIITLLIFLLIFSPTFVQLACSSCEEPKLPLPGKFQDAANWRALAPTTSRHKWMRSCSDPIDEGSHAFASSSNRRSCICAQTPQWKVGIPVYEVFEGHVAESWFPISQNDYSNHKTNDLKKNPWTKQLHHWRFQTAISMSGTMAITGEKHIFSRKYIHTHSWATKKTLLLSSIPVG